YDWQAAGRRKKKMRIWPQDSDLFSFAALEDGGCVVIITCDPAPEIAHIHDRMPVILNEDGEAKWLNNQAPFDGVRDVLRPFGGTLEVGEASKPHRQGELFRNTSN
ncbi:MAG: SOS response-associated peptidase family protein, partial [Rhodospirillaceae bacterium]